MLFLALLAASARGEQSAWERAHQEALAATPADVTAELRVRDGRGRFFQGEVIPLELAFSASTPGRYHFNAADYDRSGRLSIDSFHVDPADGAVDPLWDYFASLVVLIGGGVRGEGPLGEEPAVVEATLNEWLRFDRPGDYRLYVTSRRVQDLTAEADDRASRWPLIATGAVELTIVAAEPGWASQALAGARKDLASEDRDRRRRGCETLRHLGTRDAIAELVVASVEGPGECQGRAGLGPFAHPERDAVVDALETHLSAPDGVVDRSFLARLARLAALRDHPLAPGDGTERPDLKDFSRRVEERSAADLARLVVAVSDKRGRAQATGLTALLETASMLDAGTASELDLEALRRQLARLFSELPPEEQLHRLKHGWRQLRDPAFLPVLLELYDNPPKLPWIGGEDLRDVAIRRLLDLDPDAARELLLAEMRRPQPRLKAGVLTLLPDATLPPSVEAAVVENLRRLTSPYDGLDELSAIVGRYGSPAILGAIEEIYSSARYQGFMTCWRPPFVAYFLRVDPRSGVEKLKAVLARPEPGPYSDCVGKRLGEVAAFGRSPELEAVAVELLDSGNPELELSAGEVLRRLAEEGKGQAR